MMNAMSRDAMARWGFIVIAVIVLVLYWQIISPFAVVLLTAGVAAVVVAPLEKRLRQLVRFNWVSSMLTLLFVFVAIALPLSIIGVLVTGQAVDLANQVATNPDWAVSLKLSDQPFVSGLPVVIRDYVGSLDLAAIVRTTVLHATGGVGRIFSSGLDLLFKIFIFFICLYFFLLDRDKIVGEFAALSPFKDSIDRNIVLRMVEAVRGVVFGALIVSILQGISAGIAFTIFGIPGSLIWAAVVVVATQVPTFGSTTITMPAVLFLLLTGHTAAAIGLFVWAITAIVLIDNVIQPYVVGRQSNMHALLILLSVLGGINFFGPVGFILGPTMLAAFLVVIELYKSGILEKKDVV